MNYKSLFHICVLVFLGWTIFPSLIQKEQLKVQKKTAYIFHSLPVLDHGSTPSQNLQTGEKLPLTVVFLNVGICEDLQMYISRM